MSWDIVLFNSKQKIHSLVELDENQLEPTDFSWVLEKSFDQLKKDGNHREIIGTNFTINFLPTTSNRATLCSHCSEKTDFMN